MHLFLYRVILSLNLLTTIAIVCRLEYNRFKCKAIVCRLEDNRFKTKAIVCRLEDNRFKTIAIVCRLEDNRFKHLFILIYLRLIMKQAICICKSCSNLFLEPTSTKQ